MPPHDSPTHDGDRPSARRTRSELRELVLDAAVELLRRDGLTVRPTSVTYKQVFDHLEQTRDIKVTRGSVHERIWDSQEEFQAEAIERASLWQTKSPATTTRAALAALRHAEQQGLTSWESLSRIVKDVAPVAQAVADEDELYFAWVGLTLAAPHDEAEPSSVRVRDAVRESYEFGTSETSRMYQALGRAIGLRPRSGLFATDAEAWQTLAKLGMALSEGCTLRTRFDPGELSDVEIDADDRGQREGWHPFAVGMLALLRFFLEPEPEA